MTAWPFYVSFVFPVSFALAAIFGGPFLWLTPFVAFVGVPLMDAALGRDNRDPEEVTGRRWGHDLALWLWVPAQLGTIALGVWRVSQGVEVGEGLALAISLGIVAAGGGINVAHELMHRKPRIDQGLSEVLMTSVSYPWFCVEHVLGHHRFVATADDPATARLGQSLYTFLPQTLIGGLVSAWRLEGERVRRRGVAWTLADRRVRHPLLLVGTYALVGFVAGPVGLAFFAAQSLVAILFLETINYIEHYGLVREQDATGRPVRVQPHHSWNANHRFSNWFLYNLQRHADHHAWASRPYHQLRAHPDAPALPLGYPTMLLLALVPPAWFAVMNPRVRQVRERVVSPAA